jgi:autotransporter-associated beta strand protein
MSRKRKNTAAFAVASLAVSSLLTSHVSARLTTGDFELANGTNSNDGFFDWTAFGAAGYPANPGASPGTYFPAPYYTYSTEGATVGSQSLSVNYPIPGQSDGYYQGFSWASEWENDSQGNQAKLDAARSNMLGIDVTYNSAEWSSNTGYDNLSLIVNFDNGLTGSSEIKGFLTLHQTNDGGQGLPTYDTGNSGFPGGWDPTSFPGTTTRTEFWDYGDYVPASYNDGNGNSITNSSNLPLSQLIGSNPAWLEFVWIHSSSGQGTYHIDNLQFTETGPEQATWTNAAGVNADGTFHWGSLGNWAAGEALPSQAGDVVNFPAGAIGQATTISLNENEGFQINVGTMNFSSTNSYTIAQGTGGSLTLNGTTTVYNYSQTFKGTTRTVTPANAQINVLFGNHTISAPVNLATSVNIAVGQVSNVFTISGNITGTGGVNLTSSTVALSAGTVLFTGTNSYAGGTTVNSGTLLIGAATALPVGNAVSITGGQVQLGASIGGVTLSSLAISGNGTFDLNNNHMFISYGAGPDPIASIAALLSTGYNGGAWNGAGGIVSSAVAGNPGYGVGYADSADPGNPASLPSGTIEVAFTLLGDANLDKAVNGVDFGILAANFNKGITGWDKGDFNYDNAVNGVDFGFLAANFNKGAASASDLAALDAFAAANGLLADVPEPATIGLLAVGSLGLMTRKRRAPR